MSDREDQRSSEADPLDGQMLWVLWRHIRRADRRRRLAQGNTRGEVEDTGSEEEISEEEEDSDEDDGPQGRNCTQS